MMFARIVGMARHDYRCPNCQWTHEYPAIHEEREAYRCELCDMILEKLPSAPAFTIKGYKAATGYSFKND
jgi:rubredoxin